MNLFNKKLNLEDFFPFNFVDIHSHLLPGIDDGASDIENSFHLIERLIKCGFTQFRTTPHVMAGVYENSTTLIKQKEQELREKLDKNAYTNIQLHAAAEYMLDENFNKLLDNNDVIPLKDNYILVEMSFFNMPINLDELIFKIKLKGYIPVLAHPERYLYLHNHPEKYEHLLELGCLFQLNLLSLTEQYGKSVSKTAYKLLKNNAYTFVGTDTHHKNHIKLLKTIANTKNKKLLDPLFDNNLKTFSF